MVRSVEQSVNQLDCLLDILDVLANDQRQGSQHLIVVAELPLGQSLEKVP
jgi:hypothetical protein